ncbi:MAG: tail fiber domain-containing protein [Microcoleaceae cyanobacterium]
MPLITNSFRRLKTELAEISNGLDVIRELRPIKYHLKSDKEKIPEIGFIAEEVSPESGIVRGSGDELGLDYSRISVLCVDAIKELEGEVERIKEYLYDRK